MSPITVGKHPQALYTVNLLINYLKNNTVDYGRVLAIVLPVITPPTHAHHAMQTIL